ncbi:hypothetical protein ScPMuIL_010004 [Solemya velum]
MSRQPEGREIKRGHFMRGTRSFKARTFFTFGVLSVVSITVGIQLYFFKPKKTNSKSLLLQKMLGVKNKRRDELR